MTAGVINLLRARSPEIRPLNAARDRVHCPACLNPIFKAIAMLERTFASPISAPMPTAETETSDQDGGLAARCGPFAGLLAPAGRSALADELTDTDETQEAGRAKFTTDRGLAANVLGRRIVAARELNGLSQTELAKALGYKNSAQLSMWEKGSRPPTITGLIALADVLGVSLDYLAGRCEDPEPDLRAARRHACLRAVRTVLTAAAERIADAFDTDERVVGAGVTDIKVLLRAVETCVARAGRLRASYGGRDELLEAIDRLEGAALKVGILMKRHDDEDARQRERLAQIAANDVCGTV
jgi:transcriptional regulator with XRE-family HTH domain